MDMKYEHLRPFFNTGTLFETQFNLLSPEGLLLTTCLHHGGKEQWRSLKHVCDVAAILDRYGSTLNWKMLMAKSKELKVGNILLLGLGLASHIFDLVLPGDLQPLVYSRKMKKHIGRIQSQLPKKIGFSSVANELVQNMWLHLSLRQYWITKLKVLYYFLVYFLSPNAKDIRGREMSRASYLLLFFKKPFRLWSSHSKNEN